MSFSKKKKKKKKTFEIGDGGKRFKNENIVRMGSQLAHSQLRPMIRTSNFHNDINNMITTIVSHDANIGWVENVFFRLLIYYKNMLNNLILIKFLIK